jgi:DNA-binding XRE family transcriptional regulator
MAHDLLHIDGKPYIVMPSQEYRELTGRKPSELPEEIQDEIAAGKEHPVKIVRKYRNMTQEELAGKAGLSRTYLTEIETRRKDGSIKALKTIAAALKVDIALLASGD